MFLRFIQVVTTLLTCHSTLVLSAGAGDLLGHCQKSGCRDTPDAKAKPIYKPAKPTSSYTAKQDTSTSTSSNSNTADEFKRRYDFEPPSADSAAVRSFRGEQPAKYHLSSLLLEWVMVFFFLRLLLYVKYHGWPKPVRRRWQLTMVPITSAVKSAANQAYSRTHRQLSRMISKGKRRYSMRRGSNSSLGSLVDLIGFDDEKSNVTGGESEADVEVDSSSAYSSSTYTSYYTESESEIESDVSTIMKRGQGSPNIKGKDDNSSAALSYSSLISSDAGVASSGNSSAASSSTSILHHQNQNNSKNSKLLHTHYETDDSYASSYSRYSNSPRSRSNNHRYSQSSGNALAKFMEYLSSTLAGSNSNTKKDHHHHHHGRKGGGQGQGGGSHKKKYSLDGNSLRNTLERPLSYENHNRKRRSTIAGQHDLSGFKLEGDSFVHTPTSTTTTVQHQNTIIPAMGSSDSVTSSTLSSFITAPVKKSTTRPTTTTHPHNTTNHHRGEGMKLRYNPVSQRGSSNNNANAQNNEGLFTKTSSPSSSTNNPAQLELQTILNESINKMKHTQPKPILKKGANGMPQETKSLLELLLDRKRRTGQVQPQELSSAANLTVSDSMTEVNLQSVASFV